MLVNNRQMLGKHVLSTGPIVCTENCLDWHDTRKQIRSVTNVDWGSSPLSKISFRKQNVTALDLIIKSRNIPV